MGLGVATQAQLSGQSAGLSFTARSRQLHATAYIIAARDSCTEGLMDLSRDIGFRTVLQFTEIGVAEQQVSRMPICFFLFALDNMPEHVGSVARSIRASRTRNVRFAPMVGLTERADPGVVSMCLQLGFDDILVPPFSARRVLPRLTGLLGKRVCFYETDTYFGPGRRQRPHSFENPGPHPARQEENLLRTMTINRCLEHGISIVSEQRYVRADSVSKERETVVI